MTQKTNSFENFWKELKRRKVIRITTVYAAAAFIILQLTDIIAQPLQLPSWALPFVIVLLCIGFIIAVLLTWIYDITPEGVQMTKPVDDVKSNEKVKPIASSGWKIATYVSGIIIVALVAFNFINKRNLNADFSKLEKSIAVLPFINDSPDTTNTYFINGLMDKITTNLQMVKELRVVSRTSVEQYRNRTKSIPEIAKELDVNYIVEGNGQKYGSSFSVDVKLIKAKGKETHLWSKPYEQEIKEVKDYIKVQSQIAQAVAEELKAVITPQEKQLIEKTPTANLTAYDFYQRGREEHTKYWIDNSNRAALGKAEYLYHQALKYDSTFALAFAGLAKVYWDKHSSAKEYFSENYMDSVLILSDIAFSLDKKLAEAYTIRGDYYANRGIINKAIDEYDRSIKLNPNSWEAYYGKGLMYISDDLVKSIDNFQKAASLNHGFKLPDLFRDISYEYNSAGFNDKAKYYNLEALKLDGDSVLFLDDLGFFEIRQGNYEKAIWFLKKGYAIDSTNLDIVTDLGQCNMFLNQFKESLKYFKKRFKMLKALETFTNNSMHRIGLAYWENGYRKEAEYYFDKQLEYCKNDLELKRPWGQKLYPYYDMAGIYAFRGDKEEAYKYLKLFNQRQSMPLFVVTYMKNDPLFNSIRNEPEFQQIARDIESKYQAEHERVRKWLVDTGQL